VRLLNGYQPEEGLKRLKGELVSLPDREARRLVNIGKAKVHGPGVRRWHGSEEKSRGTTQASRPLSRIQLRRADCASVAHP
jgi:hypothetical protein